MEVISLKDVWLKYRIEFKENGKVVPEDFWALKEINLGVKKGEAVCVIGENGAGKSTLLKIIAGMLKPDRGSAQVNGTVSGLMEIGAGFQKDLTGKENIYLISSLFGLTKEQINTRYNDIIKFAAIGRFINAPVKSYSQGMYMRLAFAIAIHVDPDILLVDDLFAVGDMYAQRKCINKMFELKEKGKTIIFVTHDIETAKRFCKRSLFLKDGRVIKDGMLNEVASFYLQTVGDKKGIGVLQGKRLGVIFNNGKVLLNFDDDNLTKEWGGHTSILSSDNWYSSLQADWDLRESSKDRILLEGKFWDLPISQSWDITLDDSKNEIDLKIEIDIKEMFDFQDCRISFMFREDYNYWFNPFKKELFRVDDLSNELSWECVDSQTPAVNFIGLSMIDHSKAPLPSIVLEDNVYFAGKVLEVQNTDRNFKARVLQSRIPYHSIKSINMETGKHLFFHIKSKVMKDPSLEDEYRQNNPKTMVPKVISDKNNLSLVVDNDNKISLYWKNKTITSSKGFLTNFYYKGKNYHSSDAVWKIHKALDHQLEIILQWKELPVRQIWNLELLEKGSLSWKVYMEALERAVIRNSEFRVMFSPEYKEWIISDEGGDITEELNTEHFKNIIMRNDPYGIIGLKGILSNNLELPYVLLHNISGYTKFNSVEKKIDKNTDVLGSLDSNELVTNLYFLDINSKESMDFPKGSYLICEARILIGDTFQQKKYIEDVKKMQTPLSLKKKPLCISEEFIENGQYKFSFIKGRGRLFLKGKEITKNFGIYTSIYSKEFNTNGQWYTSLDAIWEIISFKRKRLLVKGVWPYLPIIQIWEVKASRNSFIWKVDMEIFAPTIIEKQQAYLMLSDGYSNWSVSDGNSGFFPEEFALLRWDSLYREKAIKRLCINTENNRMINILPTISFFCLQEINNFEAVIENSNTTFRSRILGFERLISKDNQRFDFGVYKYFHGIIELH